MQEFNENGVRFEYPDNWTLERQDDGEGHWTVTVQSPGTAFFLVALRDAETTPAEIIDATLETLNEEYPGVEAEDVVETFAGQPAIGHQAHFFSMDMTITAWTRAFSCADGTVLVLSQLADMEEDEVEPELKAMAKSFRVESE